MKYTLDYEKYAALARQAVADGCVLLQNDKQALPLKEDVQVALFGRSAYNYYKSGTGSGGMVNAPYVVDIPTGLKNAGVVLVKQLEDIYEGWIKDHPIDKGEGWAQEPWCQEEMPVSEELAMDLAKVTDTAIVVIGRTAGEDRDNSATLGSYLLTEAEHDLLRNVCFAFDKVIVVLNVGNIIDMKWVVQYQPEAVLYVWQGGMEGGNGVADVLTGKVNPSGKMSDTIAADIEDYPSASCYGDPDLNEYREDIYVGYRYFQTFAPDKVRYPFGFGLSYTTFDVSFVGGKQIMWPSDGHMKLRVQVKNTGNTAGREVVQIYAEAPQGVLGKPVRALICFAKTKLLAPDETQQMELDVNLYNMASYDDSGKTGHKSCWVLEAGEYRIYLGTDVSNAKRVTGIDVQELIVVEKLEEALAPTHAFSRLRPKAVEHEPETHESYVFCEPYAVFEEDWEEVPLRGYSIAERIKGEMPVAAAYTGDCGYKLSDVYDQKISMDEFLAQLSNDDLIHMTRGEGMCSPKVTAGTAGAFGGVTKRLEEFGIPIACCADGPSGIRMDCGTPAFALPNGTLLACTFDTELIEALYEMEGMELRKNQVDTLLGPGINMHRNPLNGRNFEYFSEDPLLTGCMAAAQLKGMAKYGVTGTIKHFVGNDQEYRRSFADAVISERALREIYLKPFEIAVKEGGAYSIMSTYGPVNGLWTAGSYDLLTTILRKQWGYDGIVMTDWWAKGNEEGEEGTRENTYPMVRAQNDLYMVAADAGANSNGDNTDEGFAKGMINRGQLVRGAANICRVIMRSPVMQRLLGREEEFCEELHPIDGDEASAKVLQIIDVLEGCELDVSGLDTSKGSNNTYVLNFSGRGIYDMELTLRSDAIELAQMPISVFTNNHLKHVFSITSTSGEWIKVRMDVEVFVSLQCYLKFFFGESGVEISKIVITPKEMWDLNKQKIE